MKKEELVALAKELSELESLTGRGADLALLKREVKRLNNLDEVNFKEQELINELNKYYDLLAGKEASLSTNSVDEKKALIEKAKTILNEKNYKKATEEMDQVFEAFKHSGRSTKEVDDELWNEFRAIKDQFFANRKAFFEGLAAQKEEAKVKKEAIIEEAKKALELENFKEANNRFNELLEEWKKAGFASKADNDALWASFSEIRNAFYAKRKEYASQMKSTYEARAASKQEIIKKARIALANSTFTKEEINSVKALRDEWKAVGFAGKEKDDELWNEFQSIVNKYFEELRSLKD